MNFLVGLIGGVVIGMIIACILVFVICLAVIGSLKEKEEENIDEMINPRAENGFYPEQSPQGEPNMDHTPGMEQPFMPDTDSYTKAEVNNLLNGKSNTGHSHNDLYYTETEVNNLLAGKSGTSHNHNTLYYTKENSNKRYTLVGQETI